MRLTDTIIVEPNPDTVEDTLKLLLDDREWVQAEFAAILNASGFGDRLIVGTTPRPAHRERVPWTLNAIPGQGEMTRFRTTTSRSRVRSPPGTNANTKRPEPRGRAPGRRPAHIPTRQG